jgi:aldehyde dehydrogenase (NAD(P)+)
VNRTIEVPGTGRAALDATVRRVHAAAPAWARQPAASRAALARRLARGVASTAERAAQAACRAKAIDPDSPPAGEEWLSGPYVVLRMLRQLGQSLGALARGALPPLGRLVSDRGRVSARVFPADAFDALLHRPLGISADVRFLPGWTADDVAARQASFHRETPRHAGRTCLVLGAGNINAIPVADVLTKLFVEGTACVLKLSPVNAYLAPILEDALSALVAAGWLALVQGGADEGAYLAHHPAIDEVHVTGSAATHDAIVWGPPGRERAARIARGEPLLAKPITSELGSVTPILVVPGPYSARDLMVQADNVAGMVTHNASFNCVAGKLLVLPRGWQLRDAFLDLLGDALSRAPPRAAWYPGAEERWHGYLAGRADVRRAPQALPGTLPWAIVAGLDPQDAAERAFREEAFCAVVGETSVGGEDPVEFLRAAVGFVNERVWGTLAAALVVHPETERGAPGAALERAIDELRYGTVCVNVWPGYAFAAGTTPWGAYPGAALSDVQSGRGFVHNTRMLEGVEKVVMRAPLRPIAKLPYVPSHRTAHRLGRQLVSLEASASPLRLPAVFATALMG